MMSLDSKVEGYGMRTGNSQAYKQGLKARS